MNMAKETETVVVQGSRKGGNPGTGPGQYGQDFVWCDTVSGVRVLILCDGHGKAGHDYAKQGALAFLTLLKTNVHLVQKHFATICKAESQNAVTQWLQKLFLCVEQHLYNVLHCRGSKGGTTVTVTLIVEERFIITANLGDSPAMLILKDGSYVMLTNAHSADDLEEYRKYQEYCQDNKKAPGRAVYPTFKVRGNYIPIFVQKPDGEWEVSKDNMQLFNRLAGPGKAGGVQTVRKDPENGHTNWGSTIEGKVQLLRSLGDFDQKEDGLMIGNALPSITVYRAPEVFSITLASDGVMDTHWFGDVAKHFGDGLRTFQNPKDVMDSFMEQTRENGINAGFRVDETRKPAWDDMSVCSFTRTFIPETAPGVVRQAAKRSASRNDRQMRPY